MEDAEKKRLGTMLCLAALTYRRYAEWIPGKLHDQRLHSAVERDLERGSQFGNQWRLVWGPESYRAPMSLFDDALMFVVQEKVAPHRYVVAVRGTNPVSAFDWVLGDLWVSTPVSWPYGDTDGEAAVSMSTALGLIILQNMRSRRPSVSPLLQHLDKLATEAGTLVSQIGARAQAQLDRIGLDVDRDFTDYLPRQLQPASWSGMPINDDALIDSIRKAGQAVPALRDRLEPAKIAAKAAGDDANRGLFKLLSTAVKARSENDAGEDLLTFLQNAVETHAQVEIVVTGHSKGGALAPALALWLDETRTARTDLEAGGTRDSAKGWDADRRAQIHCVAFAGPSPGNRAFADRFSDKLGKTFDRVINDKDIVPRAWEPRTLSQIALLYQPKPKCPAVLAELVESIAQRVRQLGYAHLGPEPGSAAESSTHRGRLTTLSPSISEDPACQVFAAQMIHQHLDGYFEALGLPLRTPDFFDPVA